MAQDIVIKPKKHNKSLRQFKGVNTQAARQMIDDDEFAWLENIMPIGSGNLRTVPAQSSALVTIASPCYYMAEGNISNVSYMFMFSSDGSAQQVNLTTFAVTQVAPPATFSGTLTRIAQWKNERIVIIDETNGYFDWNGTTLTTYKGTLASVTVVAGGTGFTNATTTTLTPSSGSATFSCTLGVNLATVTNAGTGYAVGDLLTISGGTFTYPCTISVTTVSSGTITGINLNTTGIYTVAPSGAASVTGGHGSSATFTLNFGIYGVTVTNAGSGYVSAPTITVGGAGAGSNASLTVNLAISISGTSIAVYSSRVWISFARTVVFTAPNSYSDTNPANLAGSFILTDETMHSNITRLYSTNGYLYIMGANAINVLSNVTVTSPTLNSAGTIIIPSTTTFSNTNITTSAGTEMIDSVIAYNRSLLFGVDFGVHALTGASTDKISLDLDGIFPYFDFSGGSSAGLCVIYNIVCVAYLFQYNDPLTGTKRPLLCMYFNKKWYFASQGANLTFVASASPDLDVPRLWGTDGLHLYQLFSDTTASISTKLQTKLWDMGDPLITKQAMKMGVETIAATVSSTMAMTVDTESGNQSYSLSGGNTAIVINNTGANIAMLNNLSQPIVWLAVGYLLDQTDVTNIGNYLGLTMTSSTPGNTFIGFHLQYIPRTEWTSVPF